MILFGLMPWPAIASAAASFLSGLMSNKAASNMQERSIAAQRDMQSWLMNNSGAMQARSAKQAGLSPAFALGGSALPSASAPSGSAMPYNIDIGMDALSKLTQSKLQKQQEKREVVATETEEAQRDLMREKANQEGIITNRMRTHDKQFETPVETDIYLDPETGEKIDDLDAWSAEHPGKFADLVQSRMPSSYGAFTAQQEISRWNQEVDDLATMRNLNVTRREQAMADKWYAKLRKRVAKLQNSSDLVVDCLANMDVVTFRNLEMDLKYKRSAISLNSILGMLHRAEVGYVGANTENVRANTENVKSQTTNNYLRNYVDAYESQDKVWSTVSYTKEQANKAISEGNYLGAASDVGTLILMKGDKIINAAKDVQQMRKGKVPKAIAKPEQQTINSPWTSTTTY